MNYYATKKTDCLAVELDSNNDEMKNENDFLNMQQLVDFMLSFF